MAFFLGIDAGGTKTVCAIGDESRVLVRTQGGSIKHMRVGKEQAGENLRNVVKQSLELAGIRADQIASSCVGTAGSRIPSFAAWVKQSLEEMLSGTIEVCGDDVVALDAAFPGGAGVLVVAGTGSNIAGRTSTDKLVNAGGWGPALGDEGSGYWIGHTALSMALRAYDWGEPTILLPRVLSAWSLPELGEAVAYANQSPPPDFSLLTPLVAECAEAGDALAMRTLLEGGRSLAECALLVYGKVRALEPDGAAPGFAFAGSVLANIAMVRDAMTDRIRRALPAAQVAGKPVDPLQGALWRARNTTA